MVVGWYHSHPGFGCWLSGVDINTQQSFEALSERAVAVVVDPIQSVKGKVSIHTFIFLLIPFFAHNRTPESLIRPYSGSSEAVNGEPRWLRNNWTDVV